MASREKLKQKISDIILEDRKHINDPFRLDSQTTAELILKEVEKGGRHKHGNK